MRQFWHVLRAALRQFAPTCRRRSPSLNLEALESRQVLSVAYRGGPLLQNVQVESVYYGQPWGSDATLQQTISQTDTFLRYFVTSPYIAALGQYNVAAGRVLSDDVVNQNQAGQTISNTQIQQVLSAEIGAGHVAAPTSNSLYVFYTAPGVVVTANGQNSVNDFAAYHDTFTDAAGAAVNYAVVPYPTGNIAPTSAPLTAFQQETIALSHEVAESITDPDTQTGWLDAQGNEICDLANAQFGTMHGYLVSGMWSNADGRVIMPTDTSAANLAVSGGPLQTVSGQTFTGLVATVTDSEPNAVAANFTTTIAWGDGSASTGTVVLDPSGAFDVFGTHTYSGGSVGQIPHHPGNGVGAGSFEVDVTIQNTSDSADALAVSTATVSAAVPALVVTGTNLSLTAGTPFSGTVGSFTDADGNGADNYTATIVWGDGTASPGTITANGAGGFLVNGSHTYATGGNDTVLVAIHDSDGTSAVGAGTASVVQVSPYLIVANGFLQSGEYASDWIVKDYQQYLGRTPNGSEIGYWTNVLASGSTDDQVLAGFLSSEEFYGRAGGIDKAWVDALYLDLLGRGADPVGEAYWLNQLAGGASRYDVVLGIVSSREHESLVVAGDYQQYLGRSGSPAEIAYWVNTMQQGASDAQVLAGFLSAHEYFLHVGNSDSTWVTSLYQHLLNRSPNSAEENYWLQVLSAGGV